LLDGNLHAATLQEKIRQRLRAAGPDVFVTIYVENDTFGVEIRPSREFSPSITLDVHGHRDERAKPSIQGSDVAWQARALAASSRLGADAGLASYERGYAISPIDASFMVLIIDLVFHPTHERALASVLVTPMMTYQNSQGYIPKKRPEGFNI